MSEEMLEVKQTTITIKGKEAGNTSTGKPKFKYKTTDDTTYHMKTEKGEMEHNKTYIVDYQEIPVEYEGKSFKTKYIIKAVPKENGNTPTATPDKSTQEAIRKSQNAGLLDKPASDIAIRDSSIRSASIAGAPRNASSEDILMAAKKFYDWIKNGS